MIRASRGISIRRWRHSDEPYGRDGGNVSPSVPPSARRWGALRGGENAGQLSQLGRARQLAEPTPKRNSQAVTNCRGQV
jgi:hypothetical protein